MNEITKHGFNFGSMEVTRTCNDESSAVVSIKTPKTEFSVRATKTGLVRFFNEHGVECKLIAKSFSDSISSWHTDPEEG